MTIVSLSTTARERGQLDDIRQSKASTSVPAKCPAALKTSCGEVLLEEDVRKLIAAMKNPMDANTEASGGDANWVRSWSQDFGLTPQIDACLLSERMYPGYEGYWTGLHDAPDRPLPTTGKLPTQDEIKWARFIAQVPHYVLSNMLTSALWPNTHFLRRLDEVSLLKQAPGKDIYLVGDAQIVEMLMGAGLVDELRLIVDPLIVGRRQRAICGDGHCVGRTAHFRDIGSRRMGDAFGGSGRSSS